MVVREQVVIVSAQPVPNLIPALHGQPERVHLLVSDQMRPQAVRLRRLLNGRGIATTEHPIDPYCMDQVEAVCHGLLVYKPHGSVLLNATGGTKVAAFGAFAAFRERGYPVVYFDPQQWRIVHLDASGLMPIEPQVELSVADYLAAHGVMVTESLGNDAVLAGREKLTRRLARELPRNPGFMRMLNAIASEAVQGGVFPATRLIQPWNHSFADIFQRLHQDGLVLWNGAEKAVTFPGPAEADYLRGFWLEEYVYQAVGKLQPFDLCRNVHVAWDGSGARPVTNEFDVVFTSRCRLFLLSCKTAKLAMESHFKDKNPLYELDSLRDAAAGLYGQGVLVSASPLGEQLAKRASTLQIVTIAGEELPWLVEKLQTVW